MQQVCLQLLCVTVSSLLVEVAAVCCNHKENLGKIQATEGMTMDCTQCYFLSRLCNTATRQIGLKEKTRGLIFIGSHSVLFRFYIALLLNVSVIYIWYWSVSYICPSYGKEKGESACVIFNSAARCRSHATDTNLTQCLTKINRMDIVHLMETSGIDPVQGHGPRTYTDTEQSMALDHSEGKWLLTQIAQGTSLSITLLWVFAQGHLWALVTEH